MTKPSRKAELRHLAALLLLAVSACTRPAPQPPTQAEPAPACRLGPDGAIPIAPMGGMPIADRGIGGTGVYADRGIGGTGIGAGKAGIVGVITGFASVCVGGQEVGYAPDVPVLLDGRPGTLSDLRAGQVTAIDADGPLARRVMVRHEVSGPLDRVDPDGALIVAGQRVIPAVGVWGAMPEPGAWLDVSGFHLPDDTISATRLDPRRPGETLVRGVLLRIAGRWRMGEIEVRPAPGQVAPAGIPVVAIGQLRDHVLYADTIDPDTLLIDPAQYFGPSVGVLILEGYAQGGMLRLGRGLEFGAPFAEGRVLTRLERRDGGFVPAFLRPSGAAGYAPTPFNAPNRFSPAPTPSRGFDRQGDRRNPSGSFGQRAAQGGRGRGQERAGPAYDGGYGGGFGGGGGGFGGGGFGPGGGRR